VCVQQGHRAGLGVLLDISERSAVLTTVRPAEEATQPRPEGGGPDPPLRDATRRVRRLDKSRGVTVSVAVLAIAVAVAHWW
jgi:hypothetical protein